MNAEIQFFMTVKDQLEFLEFAKLHCDSITKLSDSDTMLLKVSNSHLTYQPSALLNSILFTGKLEISLSPCPDSLSNIDSERTKTLFRTLRNWIKKHYSSRLAYLNQNKNGKLTPARSYWLAPDAQMWKESNQEKHILKLSPTSWMEFEIGY